MRREIIQFFLQYFLENNNYGQIMEKQRIINDKIMEEENNNYGQIMEDQRIVIIWTNYGGKDNNNHKVNYGEDKIRYDKILIKSFRFQNKNKENYLFNQF